MVAFTHTQRSTPEAHWLAARRIAAMSTLEINWASISKLVLVAAHPDDETLGAAGLLVRAAAHSVPIEVLVATWGENSHPGSPTHSTTDLAALRATELQRALNVVAPEAQHSVLGLPDGQVQLEFATLEAEIVAAAGGGGTTLIIAPWSADGHTDHDAASAAAASAARTTGSIFLEYPIWMWHWALPDGAGHARDTVPWPALRRLDLSADEQLAKAAALACHASQINPLSAAPEDAALLSSEMLSHFQRPFETFIDAAGFFTPTGKAGVSWLQQQFDAVHADGAEPWDPPVWYEQRKRALLLAGLDRPEYQSGVELGCSTGTVLAELAPRCRQLVGLDASLEALETARRRTAHLPKVACRHAILPADWPDGTFDLFVLSEIGYYLSESALAEVVERMVQTALPRALLAACHWRHPIAGWPLDGAEVHRLLRADDRLQLAGSYVEDDFMLDFFRIAAQT